MYSAGGMLMIGGGLDGYCPSSAMVTQLLNDHGRFVIPTSNRYRFEPVPLPKRLGLDLVVQRGRGTARDRSVRSTKHKSTTRGDRR